MEVFKKLYTLQDIAGMVNLNPRTLRNYLKDGTLKGYKVGGQWRFTADDIKQLFNNPYYSDDSDQNIKKQVLNFWEGEDTMEDSINVCTIINCSCKDQDQGHEIYKKLVTVINEKEDEAVPARFDYKYDNRKKNARFTLFGSPSYIVNTLEKLQID